MVLRIYIFIFFSDKTKSVSHFGNNIFNCAKEGKSDNQKQNVDEITRTFEYII